MGKADNCLYPLPVPKRSLHSAATPGARGPGLHPWQDQPLGGVPAPFGFISIAAGIEQSSRKNTIKPSTVLLLCPCVSCAAMQKNYFSRFVIKCLSSRSWTCFMRRLFTRWSTGWEFLRRSMWRATRSCLLTYWRYWCAYLSEAGQHQELLVEVLKLL